MFPSSSFVTPTPLAHADTQRDNHSEGDYHKGTKKPLITDLVFPRTITSIMAKLKIHHNKVMKIHPDRTRSHIQNKTAWKFNRLLQNIPSSVQLSSREH
ncbi:hypothetical protein TNCV_1271561 [Trichonephila clavipes]|nr:hypothetical protein TNCV_1271561 [Trichonephila clavipes]